MERYQITLEGKTPLLMHHDNIVFGARVRAWQKDPANRQLSAAGDDRCPAWTWLGSLYHDGLGMLDGKWIGVSSDNIMTMLREGGAKVPTGAKNETFKRQTQSGIVPEEICPPLFVNGGRIAVPPLKELLLEDDFDAHVEAVEAMGFSLLVKRAKVGTSKHVRVRPMFDHWALVTTLQIPDSKESGITREVLQKILSKAGSLCGLGDWRPSSRTPGQYGRFEATVEPIEDEEDE
jgi:hypothetical protein